MLPLCIVVRPLALVRLFFWCAISPLLAAPAKYLSCYFAHTKLPFLRMSAMEVPINVVGLPTPDTLQILTSILAMLLRYERIIASTVDGRQRFSLARSYT